MTTRSRAGHRGKEFDRLVRQEELILDVTERLTEALLEANVTKAELARRLGRTPGFVSQVLAGGRNLTLRTIADVAGALSLRPSLELSSEWAYSSTWSTSSNTPRPWLLPCAGTVVESDGPTVPVPPDTELAAAA